MLRSAKRIAELVEALSHEEQRLRFLRRLEPPDHKLEVPRERRERASVLRRVSQDE